MESNNDASSCFPEKISFSQGPGGVSKRNVSCRAKPYRIGILSFIHETCTYCPEPAMLDDWLATGPPSERILGCEINYIDGFESRMESYGGVELVGITSPAGMPAGGTSRSWNLKEVWEYFTSKMLVDISDKGPFDGIFLALHGSMAVVSIARPEAELVRLIRQLVGHDVVLAVTLDLHACVDAELVADNAADAVFSVKRFPHYDENLMGQHAADFMIRAMEGTYKPIVAARKPGVITPSFFQATVRYPAREIMERARCWEEREKDVYVSVNLGFAYADVPDNGASVFVVTNNDPTLANNIADDMNEYIWQHRKEFVFKKIYNVKEGVERVLEAVDAAETPVVIADGCDRTGGATWITAELIKQGASNFCIGTLADRKLFKELSEHKVKAGDRLGQIQVGGTTDAFSGDPLNISGVIVEFIDHMHLVLLFGNNNRIVVTPQLKEITSPDWHLSVGIDFNELDIVVHKTRVHFFRGYYETGIAGEGCPGTIVKIEVPGWGPTNIRKIKYVNGGQHLYPLVMDRKMGYIWDRPYIGNEDMIYQTGEGKVLK